MPKILVDELIEQATLNPVKMIAYAEQNYDNQLRDLAIELVNNENVKIVLLAGPSGSGKTTSANILKDKIVALGKKSAVVSLDNFFKNKEDYPLHKDGTPDFESVYSLDMEKIHECLSQIVKTGESVIPNFDFPNQRRSDKTSSISVGDGIIIIEGIHALNPMISQTLPEKHIFKVFVSVSTGIKNSGGNEIISGIEIRMLRRIIRDNLYRGFCAENTLSVWKSVLDGEKKWLYPYKPLANRKINTFHSFEPFVYNDYIKKNMLDDFTNLSENPYCRYFEDLLDLPGIDMKYVPETSLIKEFIPGGIYESLY